MLPQACFRFVYVVSEIVPVGGKLMISYDFDEFIENVGSGHVQLIRTTGTRQQHIDIMFTAANHRMANSTVKNTTR